MTTVFVALGSNMDAEKNMQQAALLLRTHWPQIHFSRVYKTKARDLEEQDDFLNAVARLESDESAEEIRKRLKSIEEQLHKNVAVRFGPRTIDLDLLLYDEEIIQTKLLVPHPRMHERRFVLEPLLELIDPAAMHPIIKKTWKELYENTLDQGCEKTAIVL